MIDGCLLDLDGTVIQEDRLIPGAAEALSELRRRSVPLRFITNTTRRPRSVIVERLRRLGVEASVEECLTAPAATAAWLRKRGARRVSLLLTRDTFEDFGELDLDDEAPDHVVVGDLGRDWSFEILDRAFRALMAGAELVAIQRNRYWRSDGRLTLDAGPFIAALENATGKTAHLVGKPSASFFHTAAAELELPPGRVAMVGDDLDADVEGARRAGLTAVAVRTGKYCPEDEQRAQEIAGAVLDSVADLPAWLAGAARRLSPRGTGEARRPPHDA